MYVCMRARLYILYLLYLLFVYYFTLVQLSVAKCDRGLFELLHGSTNGRAVLRKTNRWA